MYHRDLIGTLAVTSSTGESFTLPHAHKSIAHADLSSIGQKRAGLVFQQGLKVSNPVKSQKRPVRGWAAFTIGENPPEPNLRVHAGQGDKEGDKTV